MQNQSAILIVDDDLEDQQIMREAFDTLSSDVRTIHFVEDGNAAIRFLSQYEDQSLLPKLIVLDLNMPKLSGVDILKIIKANPVLKNIPVIILSSSFNPMDIEATQREGAIEYLTKPNSFLQFREIAEKFSSYCV